MNTVQNVNNAEAEAAARAAAEANQALARQEAAKVQDEATIQANMDQLRIQEE